MARPKKQTVDYFPHSVTHGKTMFVIEERYGNDGYAFWFKLLETLGDTPNHYLNMNDPGTYEFLRSKTRREEGFLEEILNLLAKLEAIDPELWEEKIIWSQKFVDGVSDVYTRSRRTEPPSKPSFHTTKLSVSDVSSQKSTQSKVKKSKPPYNPPIKQEQKTEEFERFYEAYPRHQAKEQAWRAWKKLNGTRPPIETLLNAIEKQKQTEGWRKEKKFIPLPATWLNGCRWNDEVEIEKPKSVFS